MTTRCSQRLRGENLMLPQYRGIVVWDFEYGPDANHRPAPLSATFLELLHGAAGRAVGTVRPAPAVPDRS